MIFFVKFWNNVNIRFLSHIDRVDLLATGRSKIDWVSFEELQTFPSSFFMLETCIYFDICNFFKKKYFLIFRRVNIWHPVSQHRFQHLYFWCLLFFSVNRLFKMMMTTVIRPAMMDIQDLQVYWKGQNPKLGLQQLMVNICFYYFLWLLYYLYVIFICFL